MSDDDAISILIQRRGTMYDPLIVDTFVREYAAIKAEVERDTLPAPSISPRREAVAPSPAASPEPTAKEELVSSLQLLASISPIATAPSLDSVCRDIAANMRRIARFDTAAFYAVHESLTKLECVYVDGALATRLKGSAIPLAEQLSGWVGAHQTPVWNSDAALDSLISTHGGAEIASSMPLIDESAVVGVLTLYSAADREVTVSQRRAVESLLPAMGLAFSSATRRCLGGIDCRPGPIRIAALALLDSLLSHGRHDASADVEPAVLVITIEAISSDISSAEIVLAESRAIDLLIGELATPPHQDRVLMKLSETHLLVYADGPAAKRGLSADVQAARGRIDLQQVSIVDAWVENPQTLQDRVRRISDPKAALTVQRAQRRVH